MAKNNKKKSGKGPEERVAVTSDPRFSSVHNDPRFNIPNLNKLKVKVDDRFTKELMTGYKKKATKYDRYGRKLTEEDKMTAYDRLYEQEKSLEESDSEHSSSEQSDSEESSSEEVKKELKISNKSDSESESDDESSSDEGETVVDRARGLGVDSDSSSDDSDSESSDEELSEDVESDLEIEEDKPEEGDPERRFAVVNLDWDNVTSNDLFAAFTSFLPPKGRIENVSIYPSEYGKEKMQKEDLEGPPKELFQSKSKSKKRQSSDDEDSDSDISDIEVAARKLYEEGDGEQDYDSRALRRYQIQRLRYFYAIVTCDSVGTAKAIYDNCDGTEFESSANTFDLRYVPDDMDFDDEARDTCSKIPANYKPNNFVTDALQSSRAKLTWDETPTERQKIATKLFSQREIEDMDFKAYLASDSDSEDEELLKNKYQSLAQSSAMVGDKNIFDSNGKDDEVDMEITFNPGLGDGAPKEEEKTEESTIEAYKRKEKERRKRRMEKFKLSQKELKEELSDDLDKSEAQKKAELELLTMDGDESNHFNMKDVIKAEKEKNKKRKSKKASKKIDREMLQDDFKADLSDPRFKQMFESHDFSIDPTAPNFKKTETMKQILQERQKRRNISESEEPKKKRKARK